MNSLNTRDIVKDLSSGEIGEIFHLMTVYYGTKGSVNVHMDNGKFIMYDINDRDKKFIRVGHHDTRFDNKEEAIQCLFECFPGSFINSLEEFIGHKEANEYFSLRDIFSSLEIECKVLEYFSRGCFKTTPFDSNRKNNEFHNTMLNGVNRFLNKNFTQDDMAIIYSVLGNSVRHNLTKEFIGNDMDMEWLKGTYRI